MAEGQVRKRLGFRSDHGEVALRGSVPIGYLKMGMEMGMGMATTIHDVWNRLVDILTPLLDFVTQVQNK